MAEERVIVPRPEVVEAVNRMPPPTPAQLARLSQILHDWPDRIAECVEARQRAAADDAA